MAEYTNMTPAEQERWKQGITLLNVLNNQHERLKQNHKLLVDAAIWYKNKTGKVLPSAILTGDIRANIARRVAILSKQVEALNYAYQATKAGRAGVQRSVDYPNDFDIVTNVIPVTSEIEENIFNRSGLGFVPAIAPFVPALIKAGTVIITAVLVKGCIDGVGESINENKRLEKEIQAQQQVVEKDMAQDPSIFESWTKFKTNLAQLATQGDIGTQVKSGIGGIVLLALVAIGGVFLFKMLDKKKGSE